MVHFPPPPTVFDVYDGPSLLNFVFQLKSSENAPDHTLTITSQTSVSRSFAFIQGTWQGGKSQRQFTGTISDGTVRLTCSWANGMEPPGANTLMGTVVPASGNAAPQRWEFSGNVIATDDQGNVTTGGPGMVAGEGGPPVLSQP